MGGGTYTVPTSAEDYTNEIWERPVKDGTYTDAGGTRTHSVGEYFGFGDLKSAKFGAGTSMGIDYFFAQWEVIGGFKDVGGTKDFGEGLKGHYYAYFETVGATPRAVEVTSGTALSGTFATGAVNTFIAASDSAIYGTGITVTGESGNDSFSTGTKDSSSGFGRADTVTSIVEVAVPLSTLGLTLADFTSGNILWAYAGVAVSNPSSIETDIFANDEFAEAPGSGQEYDTLRFNIAQVPEPTSLAMMGLAAAAGCGLQFRRRRRS